MTPDELRIPATEQHEATVIFLHGLGEINESWRATIQGLSRQLPKIKWILPQATSKPVTFNQGRSRPNWFDIATLPPGEAEWDGVGIAQSMSTVESIIQAEVHAGIDSRKVVLVGFSQGAALGLAVALTTLHELGGVASLSGWIPHRAREVTSSLPVSSASDNVLTVPLIDSKLSIPNPIFRFFADMEGMMKKYRLLIPRR
ncbi:hypothetical protein EW146_g3557 [Bondarzewia mesenterica]|uniref:Acyl-protein thioesterase 1 n=1 Tax=Bondarzewia mesenterica TaxID=1095465 RepID=A0A4S4LX72_9AGAM|nr:hypothetical protein EW146_g3557 [Bondarzewia mesenterica]